MALSPKMERVRDEIAWHLDEIGKMFKSPKITLVVRLPQFDDGDVVLTSDEDLDAAIASIVKLRDEDAAARPRTRTGGGEG